MDIDKMIPQAIKQAWKQLRERRSPQWPKVRKEWLVENSTCAGCGTKLQIEVHHLLPFSFAPELELVTANFLSLCEYHQCHLRIGHCWCWSDFNAYAVEQAAEQLAMINKRIRKGFEIRNRDRAISEILNELKLAA